MRAVILTYAVVAILSLTCVQRAPAQSLRIETAFGQAQKPGATDGIGTSALFDHPVGFCSDASGNIIVTSRYCVRRIASDDVVTTIAGDCATAGYVNGPSSVARFDGLSGVAIDTQGYIYVCDYNNRVLRKIAPDGYVSTFAGDPGVQAQGGPYDPGRFIGPANVIIDHSGTMLVIDAYIPTIEVWPTGGAAIRTVSATGVITTIAGGAALGHQDGAALQAAFFAPTDFVFDTDGSLLISDYQCIRRLTQDGQVSTVAGTWSFGSSGAVGNAKFGRVCGLAVNGALYATDCWQNTILELTTSGDATIVAGVANLAGSADGTGPLASFYTPTGILSTSSTQFLISDNENHTIRRATIVKDGDTNGDGVVNAADVFYLIHYVFTSGPQPIGSGDANHSSAVDVADIFYVINYLFAGGPPP